MKKYILEFIRRGLTVCGFGPIVLAVLYLILQREGVIQVLTVNQVCVGIFTLTALTFLAGGMNFIYQIEQLPLMVAILIHGGVLYFGYLGTYLVNGWLELGAAPIFVFTVFFVLLYILIWVIIYAIIKKRTDKLNIILKKQQQSAE